MILGVDDDNSCKSIGRCLQLFPEQGDRIGNRQLGKKAQAVTISAKEGPFV